jgi:hypothetical protein
VPRRKHKAREVVGAGRPVRAVGFQRVESWRGDDWVVRGVQAGGSSKQYRCPGCDHEVAVGVSHVVVWRADGVEGLAGRRHWHSACWRRRDSVRR